MVSIGRARQLVALLETELMNRSGEADRLNAYYRGEHQLRFASPEFREYFGQRYRGFSDNWTQVVADSPVERLTPIGVKAAGDDRADQDLWRVWQVNGLDADCQLGFLGAGIARRSFVLVWGDPDDPDTPEVTFEDARECVVSYVPGSRRKRQAGLKRWQDGNSEYATLYLPGEVWKFRRPLLRQARSLNMAGVDELLEWHPRDTGEEPNPQPNPMGVVPLVELPNRPMLADDPLSDVSGTVAMQDAINLLWAHLFTASDYASLPQRAILGAEMPVTPILDDAGQVVGERPVDLSRFTQDRVLWVEGEEARIGEWSAADLTSFTGVIEVAVGHIAAQTRTPQHYLIGRMANLSGDALIAAETGLVKRTEEKQMWFGQALREVFRLIALAQGDEAKARSIIAGKVLWADAESRSHAQLSDALLKLQQIGFPFEWVAARYGLTPSEITDVLTMREREMAMDPVGALADMVERSAPPAEGTETVESVEGEG